MYACPLRVLFMLVCHQVLAQDISYFPLPDVSRVAEHAEPIEMGRLLQLILGCAVRCEQQQGISLLLWFEKMLYTCSLLQVLPFRS